MFYCEHQSFSNLLESKDLLIKAIAASPLLKGHEHKKKSIKASFTKLFLDLILIAAVEGATPCYALMDPKLLNIL